MINETEYEEYVRSCFNHIKKNEPEQKAAIIPIQTAEEEVKVKSPDQKVIDALLAEYAPSPESTSEGVEQKATDELDSEVKYWEKHGMMSPEWTTMRSRNRLTTQ